MAEIEKASMTLGVYGGIINPEKDGKLLLRRRVEKRSIIPGKSFKGNWELPGGAVMETSDKVILYNYYLVDLLRNVKERTGISLIPTVLPPMHLVIFKGPAGYDLAAVTVIYLSEEPTVEDTIYVSPEELSQLAKEFTAADEKNGKDGVGLLSGYGKRMHCMALAALCQSTNLGYKRQAFKMLEEITSSWRY